MGIAVWREALAALAPTFDGAAWQVTVDGATLTIEVVPSWKEEGDLRVSVPFAQTGSRMHLVRPAHALSEEGRILTGDAALDQRVLLFGDPVSALAVLGANTRRLLIELLDLGLSFGPGRLVLEPWATTMLVGDEITHALKKMAQLSAALALPERAQSFARIAALAVGDPDPEVRRTLAALAAEHPEIRTADAYRLARHSKVADDATFTALATLVRDASTPQRRWREAWQRLLALFPVGRVSSLFGSVDAATVDFLVGQLVGRAARADAPDDAGRPGGAEPPSGVAAIAAAIHILLEKHGTLDASGTIGVAQVFRKARFTRGVPWLVRALHRLDSKEAKRAALEALLVMPVPAADIVGKLVGDGRAFAIDEAPNAIETLERPIGPLYIALFTASQTSAGASTEVHRDTVLRYLDSFAALADPLVADLVVPLVTASDDAVRVAALRTLGAIGELRHIELIAPQSRGFFRASELKQAAAAAMEAIRERHLPDAERGALALAEDGGGLALSEGEDDR